MTAVTCVGEEHPVHLIVLAGGTGERLGGRSKADIILGGTRLLDRVLEGCAPVVSGQVVVVAPETVTMPHTVARVMEQPPGGGPAAGLAAGVSCLRARGAGGDDLVLVFSVDTPMAGRLAAGLITEAIQDAACDGAVCLAGDPRPFRQYLQACYRMESLERACRAAESLHHRSVRSTLAPLTLRALPQHGGVCRDVDTPDDLAWWESRLNG